MASIGRFYGGDDGKGGAGDGGGGSDKPGGDEATKTGLSEEQINAIITKTVKRQIGEFATKQATAQEALATSLTEKLLGSLDEKLKEFKPAEPAAGGKAKDAPAAESPEFKQLRKELDQYKEKQRLSDEALKAEKKQAREAKFANMVDGALTTAGSNAAKHARAALLLDGKVRYRDDDSDEIVFVDEDGDEVPFAKAASEWLKSADGKRFMPATGAAGSGERPRGGREGSGGTGKSGAQGVTDSMVGESIANHFNIPLS